MISNKIFFGWCMIFLALLSAAFPGRAAGITITQEEELGKEFFKIVSQRHQLIQDPLILATVRKIGRKIVSVMPPQPFDYRFYVIKETVYNAFAGPGGQIFINSGLLETMESMDELAGILSHEIAHVYMRHVSKGIDRSKKIGMATLAGMLAGIMLGVGGGAAVTGNAVTLGSMAAGQSVALAFSREDEIQADQVGMDYLIKAGFSGAGALMILKKIRSKQWFDSQQVPGYLSTHPALEERIVYVGTRLEGQGAPGASRPEAVVESFRRTVNRTLALYGDENLALEKLKAAVADRPEDLEANYGYGLILARTGNRKDAIKHFQTALAKKAFDPLLLQDLGAVYFLDGRYAEALNLLEGALGQDPDNSDGLFFLGRTQMELADLPAAVRTLEGLVNKNPDYPQAVYFLSEAYGRQGKLGQAYYYLGLYYRQRGDYPKARFQLKRAREKTTDPEQQQKIDRMLKDMDTEPRVEGPPGYRFF
ncbi:MAG: M48 family metalloprotease [Desulfobacterales bacterium]|nr:M48 family metalloprotease [Desulfobacterales bacterium]